MSETQQSTADSVVRREHRTVASRRATISLAAESIPHRMHHQLQQPKHLAADAAYVCAFIRPSVHPSVGGRIRAATLEHSPPNCSTAKVA